MIPAKASCPSSWTRQYYGYVMTEQRANQYMYECVDKALEIVHGPNNRNSGMTLFPVEAQGDYGINSHNKYNSHEINSNYQKANGLERRFCNFVMFHLRLLEVI